MENSIAFDRPALVASLTRLSKRADEFGRSSWTGPSRAELEKALILVDPLLNHSIGTEEGIESARQEIQSICRALLAKMKTTNVNGAQFDVDSQHLVHACNRLLSLLR